MGISWQSKLFCKFMNGSNATPKMGSCRLRSAEKSIITNYLRNLRVVATRSSKLFAVQT